jgi:uncharacterized protein (TIGR02246 family)
MSIQSESGWFRQGAVRHLICSIAFIAGFVAGGVHSAQGQSQPRASATKSGPDRSADEAAINTNIQQFQDAYNAGDAAALAALFTPTGQIITIDGETLEGREAIEETFRNVFTESPQVQMEIFVDSIRFLGDDLALETGSTREVAAPGEAPEYGRYTVLHVKRDGKWLMAAARDSEGVPPTSHERLMPLAWLVGEWIDDGGSSAVHTSCRWSDDENYLLQDITLKIAGKDAMHVSQRLGWDPLTRCIRSWVFDSEGGFGEGVWTRVGDSWVIKSTGVRNDGTAVLATSVIVPTGQDGYVWRVHDRLVGDEILPSVEVKVVRKPPEPRPATP